MKLHSQEVRKLAPENDPLKIGMGWSVADLDKPQILVESSFGDSHPGSAHLNQFVEEGVKAVNDNGGKAARYYVTDICDGIAQGHDGINYSLAHRDMMTNMIEVHGMASGFDGCMFTAFFILCCLWIFGRLFYSCFCCIYCCFPFCIERSTSLLLSCLVSVLHFI